jgi:hypothetical protein
MEYWEFLLQKEGDHAWRSLKKLSLKLPTGKYRFVCNSSLVNKEVEIQVVHQFLKNEKICRRSQVRSRTTNQDGLLVIIPFTDLKPGWWMFLCTGTLDNGKTWRRKLRIEVRGQVVSPPSQPTPDVQNLEFPVLPFPRKETLQTPIAMEQSPSTTEEDPSPISTSEQVDPTPDPASASAEEVAAVASASPEDPGQETNIPLTSDQGAETDSSEIEISLERTPDQGELEPNEPDETNDLDDLGPWDDRDLSPSVSQGPDRLIATEEEQPTSPMGGELSSVENPPVDNAQDTGHEPESPWDEPLTLDLDEPLQDESPNPNASSLSNLNGGDLLLDSIDREIDQLLGDILREPIDLDINNEGPSPSASDGDDRDEGFERENRTSPLDDELSQLLRAETSDIDDLVAEIEQTLAISPGEATTSLPAAPPSTEYPYDAVIELDQNYLVANGTEPLIITGTLGILHHGATYTGPGRIEGAVVYEFADPQQTDPQQIETLSIQFNESAGPLIYQWTYDSQWQTVLIIGEVKFAGNLYLEGQAEPIPLAAMETFNITLANYIQQLASIAPAPEPSTTDEQELGDRDAGTIVHQRDRPRRLDLVKVDPVAPPLMERRVSNNILPPKIGNGGRQVKKNLDLPEFVKTPSVLNRPAIALMGQSTPESSSIQVPDSPETDGVTSDGQKAEETPEVSTAPQPELIRSDEVVLIDEEQTELELTSESEQPGAEPTASASASIPTMDRTDQDGLLEGFGFQREMQQSEPVPKSLDRVLSEKLDERFWDKLNLLAQDSSEEETPELQLTDEELQELTMGPEKDHGALEGEDRGEDLDSLDLEQEALDKEVASAEEQISLSPEAQQLSDLIAEAQGEIFPLALSEQSPTLDGMNEELAHLRKELANWEKAIDQLLTYTEPERSGKALSTMATASIAPSRLELLVDDLSKEEEEDQEEANSGTPETLEPESLEPTKYDASGLPYPETRSSYLQALPQDQLWEEIPEPVLILPKSEFTPGESVLVTVRLPAYPGSIYIKLWLQDLQTHMLIGGPYLLVDLMPDQRGWLEGMKKIKIPEGTMDLKFEAIAIDPQQQQESRKVGITTVVLPPLED